MYTIVGAGFGLYGYLPALVTQRREQVVLPLEYRERFERRAELARYATAIRWVPDREAAMDAASGIVVATMPSLAPDTVARAMRRSSITELILEKPVATTPERATATLAAVAGRRVRVGFTLLHTGWHAAFVAETRASECIAIEWRFMAHHFRHDIATWKRRHSRGGGVLRFYGIHLIALLADAGYDDVERSEVLGAADEPERWRATFVGPQRPVCTIELDSRASSSRFAISAERGGSLARLFDDTEPFAREAAIGEQDLRVAPVARLLASFAESDERWNRLHAATHALWQRVESLSAFPSP